jgi:ParB-like chromosome segregation protein Spo0J
VGSLKHPGRSNLFSNTMCVKGGQHFEKDKLKGLAASLQRDDLIEPIVVQSSGKRLYPHPAKPE